MTTFDRSLQQLSSEQIQALYEATVQGRMCTTPREQLEAAYRREKNKVFIDRISALPDVELLRVYQQMTAGTPTDEILRQLGAA